MGFELTVFIKTIVTMYNAFAISHKLKKLFSFFQWVHQSITNITEDSTNEKALYVTHEDICESFEGNTLLAIQAPNGTQLEVPIPEQSGLKKKYQIHLKSTDGQIYVLLGKNILQIVRAHIYISRKIRLCVVDLEGKFQTNLQAKLINFLVWKFRSTILLLLLLIFQRADIFELQYDAKIAIQICQLFGKAAKVCKKQWI